MRNRAPVEIVRCPVHGSHAARDGEGRIVSRCRACVAEARAAIAKLRED